MSRGRRAARSVGRGPPSCFRSSPTAPRRSSRALAAREPRRGDLEAVAPAVREILASVRTGGDAAVVRYIERFERRPPSALVPRGRRRRRARPPRARARATLGLAAARIESFHRRVGGDPGPSSTRRRASPSGCGCAPSRGSASTPRRQGPLPLQRPHGGHPRPGRRREGHRPRHPGPRRRLLAAAHLAGVAQHPRRGRGPGHRRAGLRHGLGPARRQDRRPRQRLRGVRQAPGVRRRGHRLHRRAERDPGARRRDAEPGARRGRSPLARPSTTRPPTPSSSPPPRRSPRPTAAAVDEQLAAPLAPQHRRGLGPSARRRPRGRDARDRLVAVAESSPPSTSPSTSPRPGRVLDRAGRGRGRAAGAVHPGRRSATTWPAPRTSCPRGAASASAPRWASTTSSPARASSATRPTRSGATAGGRAPWPGPRASRPTPAPWSSGSTGRGGRASGRTAVDPLSEPESGD